jgi:hypothetical protein
MTDQKKKQTIQEILKNPNLSEIDKRLAACRWRWNQMPKEYRNNKENWILKQEELESIRRGEKPTPPPLVACPTCKNKKFYRKQNILNCAACHPPIPNEIVEWVYAKV